MKNNTLPSKILNYQKVRYIIILLSFVFSFDANSQSLIAGWDFQTTTTGGIAITVAPNTPILFPANFGAGSIYLNGSNGSSTWVTSTTGNQVSSFGGTTSNAETGFSTVTSGAASLALLNTTANSQSAVFKFSMSGWSNLEISFAAQRSGTGFTSQQWDYSTDGSNWTTAQTISSIPTSFATLTLATITGLNNATDAYLRITFTGASSASGNNRIDNIQLNATASPTSPVITNDTIYATLGLPLSYFITASNSPTSFNASNLPSGLSINTITGEIIGTPSIANSILSNISATNSFGTGNGSLLFNIAQPVISTLNLKLYLQTYYVGSGLMAPVLLNQGVGISNSITDDITVELHEAGTYALAASSVVALSTNGLATVSFANISGNYYIVIKHRNTIETWSALPVALTSSTSYDFSTSASMAFSDNQIEVSPGVFALPGADMDQEGKISINDFNLWEADANNFSSGYTPTDLDGDGNTTIVDYTIWESNINNAVNATRPVFIIFPENMETAIKTIYTTADISLSTGDWNFDDALLGTSTVDRKTGAQSARIQNTGKLTMNFDAYVDSSIVSIDHGKYSTEGNSTWALFISTNSGSTWTQHGSTITTSSSTLQTATFNVNMTGSVRFQIRKLTGGRLNIDNFNITENTGTIIIVGIDNDHIAFGNPSMAVTDITSPNNYLMIKPQFDLAYDESKGTAAWIAWHLQSSDLGSTPRCDCFNTDTQIPSSYFRASSSNYTNTGFDRGHQVASSQRNNSITNNAITFLMSNIMPQAPNLNQDTWNDLELYCLSLVNSGYELFTYSGGYGSGGIGSNGGTTFTIGGGNINVPSHYWKVIVVLPIGNNDVSRVTTSTRVIAVDMPNTQTLNTNWSTYRTTFNAIEAATGLDFLSNLSISLQNSLEQVIDNGPTN